MTTIKELEEAVGGLSKPSKMPWYSWGIPTKYCSNGMKLAQHPGTVCNICYANKGMYYFSNVQKALQKRYDAYTSDPDKWEYNFIKLIRAKYENQKGYENRFRWFDSGDLLNFDMLKRFQIIAKLTPEIRYYLPTKEYGIVRQAIEKFGGFHNNLVVRVSSSKIGQKPLSEFTHTSTVDWININLMDNLWDNNSNCPAYKQDNQCKTCDMCWNKYYNNINYRSH